MITCVQNNLQSLRSASTGPTRPYHVPSESSGWIFYGGTPLLYHEYLDEAMWACTGESLDDVDGEAEYIMCSKSCSWNYNIMFGFENTANMKDSLVDWMRTYCIKLSEQTYVIREMYVVSHTHIAELVYAEGSTWSQWCNSFMSNSDFYIDAEGYVRTAGCNEIGYLVDCNTGNFIMGSDLIVSDRIVSIDFVHAHDEP